MRKRLDALLFALLVAAGSTACAGDRPVLQGVVVGVVDGDTADIRLDSGMIRIRFHAIDAPESGQPNGKAAKAALSQLIFGKAVEVEPFEQDRYDRLVARVWLDGRDINAEMIKSGNAWTYRRYADEPAYCAYEKAARDLGRGLWRLPPADRVAPWEWRQRKSRAGHFTDYSQETVAACVAALGR
jgi:endonuclease YncB( thermonuclease family)